MHVEQSSLGNAVAGVFTESSPVGRDRRRRRVEVTQLDGADGMKQLAPAHAVIGFVQRRAVEREPLLRVALLAKQLVHARQEIGCGRLVHERAP